MKLSTSFVWIISLAAGIAQAQFLATDSSPDATARTDAATLNKLLDARRPPLLFRVDDVISVSIYGIKDYADHQRIDENGNLLLPFIGQVHAAGLTLEQLETSIAARMVDKQVVQDPQVSITVIAQPWVIVTVSGAVSRPGVFPAYGKLTLMDYISQAGGLNESVSGLGTGQSPASSIVVIVRDGLPTPISIDLGRDARASRFTKMPIFPGDQIIVSKAGIVYAFGAFKNEGSYPLKSSTPTTVLQLATLAGGTGYQANRGDAYIIRVENNSRQAIPVNLGKIIRGAAPDVHLQPEDVLFLPTNTMKAALKGGGAGIVVALASAYIYSHN